MGEKSERERVKRAGVCVVWGISPQADASFGLATCERGRTLAWGRCGSRISDTSVQRPAKDSTPVTACPLGGEPVSFVFGRDGKRTLLAGVPGQTGGCSGNHFVAEQLLVWGAGRRGRGVLSARFASRTLGDTIG